MMRAFLRALVVSFVLGFLAAAGAYGVIGGWLGSVYLWVVS